MLLEDFINRHRNANRNPLVFPHVIVPILMITGLVIFVVGFGLSLVCSFMNVMESVFNPKFALMSTLAGLGLTVGCLFVGALWGLVKEGRSGFRRSNYETLMLMYILILSLTLPFPVLIIGKFFYHYPVVRYPAYEMVVKPTPELEREIERFGLAKIKWHTPYDYSLDRQVIRYEFLESEDSYHVSKLKDHVFVNVVSRHPDVRNFYVPTERARKYLNTVHHESLHMPEVVNYQGKDVCAVKIQYKNEAKPSGVIELGDSVQLKPLHKPDGVSVYYDMSNVFDVVETRSSPPYCGINWSPGSVASKKLKHFWMKQLMLPNVFEYAFEYRRRGQHYVVDFSFRNFLKALDQLS